MNESIKQTLLTSIVFLQAENLANQKEYKDLKHLIQALTDKGDKNGLRCALLYPINRQDDEDRDSGLFVFCLLLVLFVCAFILRIFLSYGVRKYRLACVIPYLLCLCCLMVVIWFYCIVCLFVSSRVCLFLFPWMTWTKQHILVFLPVW